MSLNKEKNYAGKIKHLEELLQQSRETGGYCPAQGLRRIGDQTYNVCRYRGGVCKYRSDNNLRDLRYNIDFIVCTFNAKKDTHMMPSYQG